MSGVPVHLATVSAPSLFIAEGIELLSRGARGARMRVGDKLFKEAPRQMQSPRAAPRRLVIHPCG